MTENKKISVDFTFAFGAIELKRKHRIEKKFSRRSIQDKTTCTGWFHLQWNSLWNHLTLKNLPKYEEEETSSSIEGGLVDTRFLLKCLVLAKKHLRGIHYRHSLLKNGSCQNCHKELRFRCYSGPRSRHQHKFHAITRAQLKVVSNRLFKCSTKNAK